MLDIYVVVLLLAELLGGGLLSTTLFFDIAGLILIIEITDLLLQYCNSYWNVGMDLYLFNSCRIIILGL